MKKTRNPAYDRWDLPPGLRGRIAAYARHLRIPKDQVVDLAVSVFFRSNPGEGWPNERELLVEMALGDCFSRIGELTGISFLETTGSVSAGKPTLRLPENSWNLPHDLDVLSAAYAGHLKISRDELMHIALRGFFYDTSMHEEDLEELRDLVLVAVTSLLDDCEPAAPNTDSPLPPLHRAGT
jgi:hypothetical protein